LAKDLKLPFEELNELFENLDVIQISEEEILDQTKSVVADNFDLINESVDYYILVLIAKFLERAHERKVVSLPRPRRIKN